MKNQQKQILTGTHGHMVKTKRQIIEDLKLIDIVVEILKNKYQKREEVDIDCSMINTRSELIDAIKHALQYPHFCGDNWDAIEDLIYDIVLPQKLILHNWREVEKKLPQDTAILKSILDKYNNGRCVVIYT